MLTTAIIIASLGLLYGFIQLIDRAIRRWPTPNVQQPHVAIEDVLTEGAGYVFEGIPEQSAVSATPAITSELSTEAHHTGVLISKLIESGQGAIAHFAHTISYVSENL